MIGAKLIEAAGNGISTVVVPAAIDFDGTNDYLSRSTDLVGNADGKTFTFSAWVWLPTTGGKYFYESTDGSNVGLVVLNNSSNQFRIIGYNVSGTAVLNFSATSPSLVAGTFIHLLASVDLTSTSNRYVYINDVPATVTWTTYTNDNIDFTKPTHQISRSGGSVQPSGRLSNVYLDYTYRDLSITANRRKFIAADRKPALRNDDGSEAIYTGLYADSRLAASEYGVLFNGTTNTLTKASDLTGIADSKTLTFSMWVLPNRIGLTEYPFKVGSTRFTVNLDSSGVLQVVGENTSGTNVLVASTNIYGVLSSGAWNHVMFSCNLANSSQRHLYINGQSVSVTWTTYSNTAIDFTNSPVSVGTANANTFLGRLAHLFFDTTYRDLSVQATRELFLASNGTPASGQTSLNPFVYLPMTDSTDMGTNLGTGGNFTVNGTFSDASNGTPILYLPMDDPTQPGLNLGTGGNFTLTGTVARSGRGPNQFNAPYSDLDGSTQYLSRTTAPTGIADSKTFTLNFAFNADAISSPIQFKSSASTRFELNVLNPKINFQAANASGTTILDFTSTASIVAGRNYVLTVSIDLNNTANRHVYLNGELLSGTWGAYTNAFIDFDITTTPIYYIGRGAAYYNGRIGAFWFNTSYIDLSVAANLAKFVTGTGIDAKPVDLGANGELPTGSSPLIYLPMYGNNAGKNYGTGGDFTVNSGPYPGARGPNEFWGNKAIASVSGSRLYATNGVDSDSSSPFFSASGWIYKDPDTGNLAYIFAHSNSSSSGKVKFGAAAGYLGFYLEINGSAIFQSGDGSSATGQFPNNSWVHFCICVDLSDNTKRFCYLDGVLKSGWKTYSNSIRINYTNTTPGIFRPGDGTGGSYIPTRLSELFIANSYIDFSQEANRLKFRDAFGNPVDLTQQIEDAAIPNPAIYMRFDPASFGTNSGTGGDFTVNGTITDGGQL